MRVPARKAAERDYLVPDLLMPGLKLVLCGTAPSHASAKAKAYYAKPGNRFWPALFAAGLTPRLFQPSEYAELLQLQIGLTDLCKVYSGVDDVLPEDAFDVPALRAKIERYQPRWLAFTSKNAARAVLERDVAYGVQRERMGDTRLFVLTSPSGQATRFWRIDVWQELGRLVHAA